MDKIFINNLNLEVVENSISHEDAPLIYDTLCQFGDSNLNDIKPEVASSIQDIYLHVSDRSDANLFNRVLAEPFGMFGVKLTGGEMYDHYNNWNDVKFETDEDVDQELIYNPEHEVLEILSPNGYNAIYVKQDPSGGIRFILSWTLYHCGFWGMPGVGVCRLFGQSIPAKYFPSLLIYR